MYYYNSVQVGFHEIKDHVKVLIIFCLDDVEESDDILVAIQLLEEHDFPKGPLCVGCVVKSVKNLLQSNDLFSFLTIIINTYLSFLSTAFQTMP